MTNYKQIFFGACLMLLLNTGSAFSAASPGKSSSPQTSLFDAPLAASSSTTRVAGVYWLPDFLKSNTGRTETCEGTNCGNKDPERSCAAYGYDSACASPKEYSSIKTPVPGMTCYQNCHCPSKFQYTTANCKDSEGKMTDGVVCEGKAEKCICKPKVTLGAGEKCDLMCGGNCVKKSCKAGVSVGTGEQCNERCASNTGICTSKGCKATVSIGTGERCTENCATGGACTAKACKGSVSVGTGEQCNERCASNSSICTAKGCKASKSVPSGYTCTERCASNSNICTGTGCVSTAGKRTCSCGGSGQIYSCGTYYYDSCYSCCAYNCSLSSCPTGGNCSYESCSGKYCLNSCQSGYNKSGNTCVASCGTCPYNDGSFAASQSLPSCIQSGSSCSKISFYGDRTVELKGSFDTLFFGCGNANEGCSTNQTINVYGNFTTANLYIAPGHQTTQSCNLTINFYGKVTVTSNLTYMKSGYGLLYGKTRVDFNLNANFRGGKSGSYSCNNWVWASSFKDVVHACP